MSGEGPDRLETLRLAVRAFAEQRDWQQFHNAKNLTMALAGEVGELLAELQWIEPADLNQVLAPGTPTFAAFEEEAADVFIYLLRLADVAGLDLVAAAQAKLESNRLRYSVELSHGSAKKQAKKPEE